MNTTFKKKAGVVLFIIFAIFCGLQFVFNNSLTANAEIALTASADGSVKTSANSLTLHPYSYSQDFEKEDPFVEWAKNGTYTVNFKGLTSERASSGQKSLKIDLTFGTATYIYWQIPVKVPAVGELNFKGDIYVSNTTGASAALGVNIHLPPTQYSGVNTLERHNVVSTKWLTENADIVDIGNNKAKAVLEKYCAKATTNDVGILLDRIGLFIFGKPGDKITLFIDNCSLKGKVPNSDEYSILSKASWTNYKTNMQSVLNEYLTKLANNNDAKLKEFLSSALATGYPNKEQYDYINSKIQEISFKEIVVYPWEPFYNQQLLPTTYPLPVTAGNSLSIQACPGEYEPASFVIRSLADVSNIEITLTDLSDSLGKIIPKDSLDIKVVKCWYQAGTKSINPEGGKFLVPELLLHDDSLIKVDTKEQKNFIRINSNEYVDITMPTSSIPKGALIEDSLTLRPFSMEANTNKQIFITAQIPNNTAPGTYSGTLTLSSNNNKLATINLNISVLPFQLANSRFQYGLYYRARLRDYNIDTIGSNDKTISQYKIELKDMKEHGVLYPTLYQQYDNLDKLKEALDVRNELGFPKDSIYVLGTNTGNSADATALKSLKERISLWVELLKSYGYENVYIYSIDEAKGELLLSQRKAWETVHEAGAKVFAANSVGAADLVGDILDLAISSAGFKAPQEIERWKNNNKKIFSYANPQVGVEKPELYRNNYGFDLVCNSYDGAINYAYQHAANDIWNDFDDDKYRDHVFTYPVSNGVISTLSWEGFREGIDDVRYLSTLIERSGGNESLLLKKLCEELSSQSNFNEKRKIIINKILESIK